MPRAAERWCQPCRSTLQLHIVALEEHAVMVARESFAIESHHGTLDSGTFPTVGSTWRR